MRFSLHKLGNCLTLIENGIVIKQSKNAKGIPITRIETLSNDTFNRDRLGFANIFDVSKYSHNILDDMDLIMSHINSRQYLGRTVIYEKLNDEQIIHGMNVLRIKTNKDILLPFFAYYLFKTIYFKKKIDQIRKDAINQSSLSISDIKNIIIPLPKISDQIKILNYLKKLDDKIKVNLVINQNLEAMAKQLYDYWFVQFDFPDEGGKPYKSSGGKMVWNEKLKRKIPEGWVNCTLENFLTIKNGRDHKHLTVGQCPVYGSGGEIRRVNVSLYKGESVLMPRKGSLNNIMYVNESFWTVDTMFYSEMKVLHCAKYVFFSIRDIDFTKWDSGTGVPSMTASTLYSISMMKPNVDLLKRFDDILSPIFYKIKQIKTQIEELAKLRDELLPLLMNGQVSVNSDLSDD